MLVVHDINRPDVAGVAPKMLAICEAARLALAGVAPYLSITTDDNLMSSVTIRGSFDARETWTNNIFHNSRYFIGSIVPMEGRRYYNPSDQKVTIEFSSLDSRMSKFRKYTGPIDKVIAKVKEYLSAQPTA